MSKFLLQETEREGSGDNSDCIINPQTTGWLGCEAVGLPIVGVYRTGIFPDALT